MKTDRELMEMAAKAAGYEVQWNDARLRLEHRPADERRQFAYGWLPLADDGDALRLAVKLEMKLQISGYGVSARAGDSGWVSEIPLDFGIQAATRRAIVLAAAEVGRSMP